MTSTSKSTIALLVLIVIAIISITTILFVFLTPEPVADPEIIADEDAWTFVDIIPNNPTVCEFLSVEVKFSDNDGVIDHMNYDIEAIQNKDTILSELGAHRHPNKEPIHESGILLGVFPVDITVTLQGIGHGDDIIPPIGNQTSLTITPQTAISIDCEELHITEDELPQ